MPNVTKISNAKFQVQMKLSTQFQHFLQLKVSKVQSLPQLSLLHMVAIVTVHQSVNVKKQTNLKQ